MNVATSLNRAYIKYAIVMLTSFCDSNREHNCIYLLNDELNTEDIELIRRSLEGYDAEVVALRADIGDLVNSLPTGDMWTKEIYYRLLLPELLPAEVEKTFYLDVDVIVHGSLSELYNSDFEGADLFAASDSNDMNQLEDYSPKQQEMFAKRAPEDYKYFNSGVLLLNIRQIREKYTFSDYLNAMKEWNFEMSAPDQDVLNYVHCDNVKYMDYRQYDLFARLAYNNGWKYNEALEKNKIIHFAGDKPWNWKNTHYIFEKLWWDYAAKTPVYKELIEEFLESAFTETRLEENALRMSAEVDEYRKALRQANEILQKFMA
jgi:lipopolysaccharide biosynthesis glycosyltransferase